MRMWGEKQLCSRGSWSREGCSFLETETGVFFGNPWCCSHTRKTQAGRPSSTPGLGPARGRGEGAERRRRGCFWSWVWPCSLSQGLRTGRGERRNRERPPVRRRSSSLSSLCWGYRQSQYWSQLELGGHRGVLRGLAVEHVGDSRPWHSWPQTCSVHVRCALCSISRDVIGVWSREGCAIIPQCAGLAPREGW